MDAVVRFAKLLILCFALLCLPSFGAVTHVASATKCSGQTHSTAASGTWTFSCTPNAANDAILFVVECNGTGTATAVSLAASGWTITALSAVYGSAGAGGFAATFGALALNTSATTFTATFTGSTNCSTFTLAEYDEFAGNDTTGGTTTFDAHNQNSGTTGGCSGASTTPANNNDAIWFSCIDSVTAVTGSYTKGEDDTQNDWTEFQILSGGSGVGQTPGFTTSGAFLLAGATVKPAGGGATAAGFNKRRKLEKVGL